MLGSSTSVDFGSNTGWFEMYVSSTSPPTANGYRLVLYVHDLSSDFEIYFDDAEFADEVISEFIMPISFILMTFLAVMPIFIILKKRFV